MANSLLTQEKTRFSWGLIGVFTLSIFLSATLLFSVQPMFTKMVLPLLGGSSNVWNTAMVFFQAMLLGGYIYAHVLSKYAPLRLQVVVHTLVLAAGLVFLPLALAQGWTPPESGAPAFWLMGLFAVSVGVPFFAISANAPLLQRWFSYTDHKDAQDPYFLYAASNLGSLLSLCLYPVLFEPMMRLHTQTGLWAQGYMALIAIIAIAGLTAYTRRQAVAPAAVKTPKTVTKSSISWKTRAIWIFFAFIPSSLMLGVTTFMTNNIASGPFLWIIPLALYLLTFVFVFASKPIISIAFLTKIFPVMVPTALIAGGVLHGFVFLSIVLSLMSYFFIAMLSHARLVEMRPEPSRLTEFYIFMSFGGMLGGIFNALIAPVAFNGIYEYGIVLLAALWVMPGTRFSLKAPKGLILKLAAMLAVSVGLFMVLERIGMDPKTAMMFAAAPVLLTFYLSRETPHKLMIDFSLALGVLVLLIPALMSRTSGTILQERSFFGVVKVLTQETELGTVHTFVHGDTIHNKQIRGELETTPLAYYAPGNTFEAALSAARNRKDDLNVAVIGLGAGAMACYERPADSWTYFEIDPSVVRMAMNPDYFSYMEKCSFEKKVLIGDARLKVTEMAPKSQDLIMVDAFSSDSIPAHLVTTQALELYRGRLKDDGLIFFHTSNRTMDISSVVVTIAEDAGLTARHILLTDFEGHPQEQFITGSSAVLVGQKDTLDQIAANDPRWTEFVPSTSVGLWSDDYYHVIGTLWAKRFNSGRIVTP